MLHIQMKGKQWLDSYIYPGEEEVWEVQTKEQLWKEYILLCQ